jgi:hypothetical protein
MRSLTIKNIGPIKYIHFKIKKVNIFMGKQSSGKSTIAKLLSFCSWIEKDVSFHQSFKKYADDSGDLSPKFITIIENFHKMEGYFKENSEIHYKGDAISIIYKGKKGTLKWLEKGRYKYKRPKISYIPSERSVIILPEMEKLDLPNNYLRSYLYDWLDTRKSYTPNKKFSLLDTNIKYYFLEEERENRIEGKNYSIQLSQSSSGMQSLTPLLTMVDNLISNLYTNEVDYSYEFRNIRSMVSRSLMAKFVINPILKTDIDENDEKYSNYLEEALNKKNDKLIRKYRQIMENLFEYHRTNLIIEEPEQNLFPATQKKLAYKLLEYINNSEYDHTLTLTTHSPYILYAINNCILTYLVRDKAEEELSNIKSAISPDDINLFEIEQGIKKDIKKNNGLIGDNYFDKIMKEVMDDFYQSLNYL